MRVKPVRVAFLLAAMLMLARSSPQGGTERPLESAEDGHWLMGTFEFSSYGGWKLHGGFDIPALSADEPGAPIVRATVDGDVHHLSVTGNDDNPRADLRVKGTTDGKIYTYGHIDNESCTKRDPSDPSALPEQLVVAQGEELGKVWRWAPQAGYPNCDVSHLHYGVHHANRLEDPTDTMVPPFQDTQPPEILDVHFCKDDQVEYNPAEPQTMGPWQDCTTETPGQCHVVEGAVDMVVKIEDRHHPAPVTTWDDIIAPKRLRYRYCRGSTPICSDWIETYDFSVGPPISWSTDARPQVRALYSLRSCALPDPEACISKSNYCTGDAFWFIPTNVVYGSSDPALPDGTLSAKGTWDTTGLHGHYSVTIEATDFSGNWKRKTVPVCVGGDTGGYGKLVIRDCRVDNGAEPAPCDEWRDGPDIIVGRHEPNSEEVGDRRDILPTDTLELNICMTNMGSGPISPDTVVFVGVFMSTRAISILEAFRGPSSPHAPWVQIHASHMKTRDGRPVFPEPWKVGEERCAVMKYATPFTIEADSPGPASLFGVVAMEHDSVFLFGGSVLEDNNMAQKTLARIVEELAGP